MITRAGLVPSEAKVNEFFMSVLQSVKVFRDVYALPELAVSFATRTR
jgi:hypothetical protein